MADNTIINFKTNPALKRRAQKKAAKMGLSLTSVLNAYLKDFLNKDELAFVTKEEKAELELTPWAEKQLARADKDVKEGYVSPAFDNVEDEIAWLNDPSAKYVNGSPVHPKVSKNDQQG